MQSKSKVKKKLLTSKIKKNSYSDFFGDLLAKDRVVERIKKIESNLADLSQIMKDILKLMSDQDEKINSILMDALDPEVEDVEIPEQLVPFFQNIKLKINKEQKPYEEYN
jgi:hypothetical protein